MATATVQSSYSPIIVSDNGFTRPLEHHETYKEGCQGLIYVDTCALADLTTPIMYRLGLATNAVVLRSVRNEITKLSASPEADKRDVGYRAAHTLAVLYGLPRVTVIMDSDEPTANYADPDLIKRAWLHKGRILTADVKLQEEASAHGIDFIDVNAFRSLLRALTPELANIFPLQHNYVPGDVISVRIDRLGEKDSQGVGYLADGRMVVVTDGAFHLGAEVEVIVTRLHKSSSGSEMVFAQTV